MWETWIMDTHEAVIRVKAFNAICYFKDIGLYRYFKIHVTVLTPGVSL